MPVRGHFANFFVIFLGDPGQKPARVSKISLYQLTPLGYSESAQFSRAHEKKAPQTETVPPPPPPPNTSKNLSLSLGPGHKIYPIGYFITHHYNHSTNRFRSAEPFFVFYKQQDEKKISTNKGFHMSLTTQQPKGQCVWGARAIILVTGKHFAEK